MEHVRLILTSLKQDRGGVTAVEYALMAGLIAVAIIAAVSGVASSINGVLSQVSSAI